MWTIPDEDDFLGKGQTSKQGRFRIRYRWTQFAKHMSESFPKCSWRRCARNSICLELYNCNYDEQSGVINYAGI